MIDRWHGYSWRTRLGRSSSRPDERQRPLGLSRRVPWTIDCSRSSAFRSPWSSSQARTWPSSLETCCATAGRQASPHRSASARASSAGRSRPRSASRRFSPRRRPRSWRSSSPARPTSSTSGSRRSAVPMTARTSRAASERSSLPWHRAWLQGLLSALLNPKLGVFFVTLLPQFISPGDPPAMRSLQLAVVFDLIGLAWLLTYSAMLSAIGAGFRRQGPRRFIRWLTGTILVGLGDPRRARANLSSLRAHIRRSRAHARGRRGCRSRPYSNSSPKS